MSVEMILGRLNPYLRIVVGVLLIFIFSNVTCNYLYHKIEKGNNFKINCPKPNIINGLIYLDYTLVFKPKVFDKVASYIIMPVLVAEDTIIHFNTHILQGESIDSIYPVVSWSNGGDFTFIDSAVINNVNLKRYHIEAEHMVIRGSVDEPYVQMQLINYLMYSNIEGK